ncbi:MAG TPA: hypothetical protein VHR88_00815 [Solirubrobacteraceae bacterium]|nr:hypothetical protein [Solirubrobacteraceae bacterium]
MITPEETAREKDRLPRGWGRFGKSIDALADASEPDETLLAACVGINPTFKHRAITLARGAFELTKSTNVVLGATDRRVTSSPPGPAARRAPTSRSRATAWRSPPCAGPRASCTSRAWPSRCCRPSSMRCNGADRPDRRRAHSGHSNPPNRPIRPP